MIEQLFKISCERYGINTKSRELKLNTFRRPGEQLNLFD
jgi:hypothetical protein